MLKPEEREYLLNKKENTLANIRLTQEWLDRYDYLIKNDINVSANTDGKIGRLKDMKTFNNDLKEIEDQLNSGKFNGWD